MTPASFAAIRKVKVGTSDKWYVIDPQTIQNDTALQLLGLPVIITDNIPDVSSKARVALVDFSKIVVARDIDADVAILTRRGVTTTLWASAPSRAGMSRYCSPTPSRCSLFPRANHGRAKVFRPWRAVGTERRLP